MNASGKCIWGLALNVLVLHCISATGYKIIVTGSVLPSTRETWSFWSGSSGEQQRWWSDWNISLMVKDWGSWACSVLRRNDWQGISSMSVRIGRESAKRHLLAPFSLSRSQALTVLATSLLVTVEPWTPCRDIESCAADSSSGITCRLKHGNIDVYVQKLKYEQYLQLFLQTMEPWSSACTLHDYLV